MILFLTDWLPRKVALDAEQRAGLPETLRRWLRFALERRGVASEWIEPVVAEVDALLPEFEVAYDDESSLGSGQGGWSRSSPSAASTSPTARPSTTQSVRSNSEHLARRLIQE